MSGSFSLYARQPGALLASLDHPELGRRMWLCGTLCAQRGRARPAERRCAQCDRVLVVGDKAFRPLMTTYHVRKMRICAPCVDQMAVT